MTHLRQVLFADLTPQHLQWIAKYAKMGYYGEEVEDVLKDLAELKLLCFEVVDSPAKGIFLLNWVQPHRDKVMWITFMAGKGFIKHGLDLWRAVHKLAAETGAARVTGIALSPALAKFYVERLGASPTAQLFTQEVIHG